MLRIGSQGFTLLEVLIALAILSFGLLGFAEALLIASEQDRLAYLQSLAANQISNMAERLQACRIATGLAPMCLAQETTQWQQENALFFPRAESKITAMGTQYLISIHWQMPFRSQKDPSKSFLWQQIVQI